MREIMALADKANQYIDAIGDDFDWAHMGGHCGKGQGGSLVAATLGDQKVEFTVEDTGHFQNFIWRHIGEIGVSDPGVYALKISATKIAKGAVMDVRAVSLTRLPD